MIRRNLKEYVQVGSASEWLRWCLSLGLANPKHELLSLSGGVILSCDIISWQWCSHWGNKSYNKV